MMGASFGPLGLGKSGGKGVSAKVSGAGNACRGRTGINISIAVALQHGAGGEAHNNSGRVGRLLWKGWLDIVAEGHDRDIDVDGELAWRALAGG